MTTPSVVVRGLADPRRRGSGALILVVLVALLIILILYFNTGYTQQVSQTRKKGKQLAQDINTQQLTIMISQYRQENGKLPKTWADMEGLSRESYLDPWGKEMTFKCEEDKRSGKTTVIFHSDGPDGEPGNEDDINRKETLQF